MILNKAITSLAVLKANWDARHFDYVEVFVPFFVNLIIKKKYKLIAVEQIKNDFEDEYGLHIPSQPIIVILNRLKGRGFIYKNTDGYAPTPKIVEFKDFASISSESQRMLEYLIVRLREYAKKEFEIEFDKERTEKALLNFFQENELGIFYESKNYSVIPYSSAGRDIKFIVAKFIFWAKLSEPELYDFILRIAVGSVLASTIIYGQDLKDRFSGKMEGIQFYLDTSYLMGLLGVDGHEIGDSFSELTTNLLSCGAKLNVFEHTYDEMMSIFSSARFWISQSGYDPLRASRTMQYFINNDYQESDIDLFIAKIPNILKSFKINKICKPEYSTNVGYQIDELKLRTAIVEEYGHNPDFVETEREDTISKDIQSIYAVCKLRGNRVIHTIHEAGHVFITRNNALAIASRSVDGHSKIPPCITDLFIGTLLWLQNPIVTTKINDKKLIADAYAATKPDLALINRYLSEIEFLKKKMDITEEQYFILRSNKFVYDYLSNITVNDVNNFKQTTIPEILNQINIEHISKYKHEAEVERTLHDESKKELERNKQVIGEKDKEIIDLKKKISRIVNRLVSIGTWVVFPLVFALIIATVVLNILVQNSSISTRVMFGLVAYILSTFSLRLVKKWIRKLIEILILRGIYRICHQ